MHGGPVLVFHLINGFVKTRVSTVSANHMRETYSRLNTVLHKAAEISGVRRYRVPTDSKPI